MTNTWCYYGHFTKDLKTRGDLRTKKATRMNLIAFLYNSRWKKAHYLGVDERIMWILPFQPDWFLK